MDMLELNAAGVIVIDCQTSTGVPGVFAAGDVTHVRNKQVLVAAGEGVKATLRTREYLLSGR
jgi:alkyl hydroperoxide reductase subunit F